MKKLFSRGQSMTFDEKEVIPIDQYIYRLSSGYVGLYSRGSQGNKLLLIYQAGDVFPSINSHRSFPAWLSLEFMALCTVTTERLSQEEFAKLTANNSSYMQQMVEHLEEVFSYTVERISNLDHKNVRNRLLHQLVYFARRFGHQADDQVIISIPLRHQDIADTIGTTRESVNRALRQLEKRGIISMNEREITIHSLSRLIREASKKA